MDAILDLLKGAAALVITLNIVWVVYQSAYVSTCDDETNGLRIATIFMSLSTIFISVMLIVTLGGIS